MSDIVNILRAQLEKDPKFRKAFEAAFLEAKTVEPDVFNEFQISTFADYIDFYENTLSWVPTDDAKAESIYTRLCLFYFVIDLPEVQCYQTPISPQSQTPWTWLSQWLIDYSNVIGKNMDKSDSLTPESLATFYASPPYHMQDYPVPPGGWKNFNEFFARHIDPKVRPIDSPDDPTVIVSPADCAFDGAWPIDDNADVTTFDVKGVPWPIGELLKDSSYAEKFKGGIFTHSFLSPHDYHRQHAPVAGTVIEAKVISGLCYLQVSVEVGEDGKRRLKMRRTLNAPNPLERGLVAPNDPGYQFLQARALILLHNPDIGYVAVLPIGMAQISSVVLSVKEGQVLKKGDEMSYFQFGGSDVVVVYQDACKVEVIAVQDQWYPFGKHVATAQRIPK